MIDMKKLEFKDFKKGMFIRFEEGINKNRIYGRVMDVSDTVLKILSFENLIVSEIELKYFERGTFVDYYAVYNTDKLKQYLLLRKEVLLDIVEELKTEHFKKIAEFNYDISRLDVCINHL